MQLTKITVKNYRLLIDAELEVDPKTTLIVGRKSNLLSDYPFTNRRNPWCKTEPFFEKSQNIF